MSFRTCARILPDSSCQVAKLRINGTCLIAIVLSITAVTLRGCSDSSDRRVKHATARSVERTTDQEILARIAVEALDSNARHAAVNKLTDQTVLAKIAVDGFDSDDGAFAASKLTDETMLAKVVLEAPDDSKVCRIAVWRLVDTTAIKKINDPVLLTKVQKVLSEIAVDEAWWSREAVERITDETMLVKVAVSDSDARIDAVEKLTEQAALATVSLGASDPYVCDIAVKKLTEQAALVTVSLGASDPHIRYIAVEKLTEQAALATVSIGDSDPHIRYIAVEKLTNQTVLAKIAVEDTLPKTRLIAVEKLTNQTVLAKIAVEDTDRRIRAVAAKKINDEAMLARIAVGAPDRNVRWDAAEKISDEPMLAMIVAKAPDPGVRYDAAVKLIDTDQAILAKIAEEYRRPVFTMLRVVIPAFAAVPEKHRRRLTVSIMPAVSALCDSDVVNHVGELVAMNVAWGGRLQPYTGVWVDGEKFICSIHLKNLSRPVTVNWTTAFPHQIIRGTTPGSFFKAPVTALDLLDPVFKELPQSLLAKIAVEGTDSDARRAAVRKLTDQELLAKIAVKDTDVDVRSAAAKKLKKQPPRKN